MPDIVQICSECNLPIEDQFIMRVGDSILHEHCLRCVICQENGVLESLMKIFYKVNVYGTVRASF